MAITKNRDVLRLEIGDTDENAPLYTDEELDVFLRRYGLTGNATDGSFEVIQQAAGDACYALANRFAQQFDFSEDGQSFSLSQRANAFAERARQLRSSASGGYSVPVISSVIAAQE